MWNQMGHYSWDGGWGMMGFGLAGISLFWLLLIVALVLLLKGLLSSGRKSDHKPENTAMDIVKERYARGEIDRDEFEQKKRDLSS